MIIIIAVNDDVEDDSTNDENQYDDDDLLLTRSDREVQCPSDSPSDVGLNSLKFAVTLAVTLSL